MGGGSRRDGARRLDPPDESGISSWPAEMVLAGHQLLLHRRTGPASRPGTPCLAVASQPSTRLVEMNSGTETVAASRGELLQARAVSPGWRE